MQGQLDARQAAEIREAADEVHHQLWTRFMSPDHHIYDYVGLNGEVSLPTPDECRDNQPNALGWWSPIEDGAFFTGSYLFGQCGWYQRAPTEQRRDEIKKLVAGLYKLQDVGVAPGMIARGVGADGTCHYPASSNDQNIPWLTGLREYLKTGIATPAEAAECRDRLRRQLTALEAAGWQIPGEQPGFTRGSLLHIDGLEGSLSAVHFAFVTKLQAELAGDAAAAARHRNCLTEPLANGRTRLQIIGEGFTMFENWHSWFTANSQCAVRELCRAETDPRIRDAYWGGLKNTGRLAADAIGAYRAYVPGRRRVFTPEWRVMLKAWKAQQDCREAEQVAHAELPLWHAASPAVQEDKETLLQAMPAAWLVMMSEDPELIGRCRPEICRAIRHFDYGNLHYGALFYVENVVQEMLGHG